MVGLLVPDVLDRFVQLRNTYAESRVFHLPRKGSVFWESVVYPFGRAALDELQRLGDREGRGKGQ